MKIQLCILILVSLGCTNQSRQTGNTNDANSTNKVSDKKTDNSKYYTTKDSLTIVYASDTVTYTKEAFNQLIDEHPEFFEDHVQDPDFIYHCVGDGRQFGSELGQDKYYVLYAYFLKQKNADEKYAEVRNKITGIYNNINSLFQYFQHGGTYFGHQQARISAYAEFAVYRYVEKKNSFEKTYNISKQKGLYIQSLRQLITDESSIDFETNKADKPARIEELNQMAESLDSMINNNFYLRKAQEFQYNHYQYY